MMPMCEQRIRRNDLYVRVYAYMRAFRDLFIIYFVKRVIFYLSTYFWKLEQYQINDVAEEERSITVIQK